MIRNFVIIFLSVLCMFMVPVSSFSHEMFTALNRVDSFIYLVDYSGSMMMMDKKLNCTKLEVSKNAMINVNRKIPEHLKFTSKVITISPNDVVYNNVNWDKKIIENEILKIKVLDEIFGRMSPLYDSILKMQNELTMDSRKVAIVLVSDGDFNVGKNPKYLIDELYKRNSNLVFHIISVADTVEGEKVLKDICLLNKNSVYVKASNLLTDNESTKFAENVFFGYAKVINGYFDFDKYNLKDVEIEKILNGSEYILENFLVNEINILGWTDNRGSKKYNKSLSEKRAKTSEKLINEVLFENKSNSDIKISGEGISNLYDNKIEEGRMKNRHVDIFFN